MDIVYDKPLSQSKTNKKLWFKGSPEKELSPKVTDEAAFPRPPAHGMQRQAYPSSGLGQGLGHLPHGEGISIRIYSQDYSTMEKAILPAMLRPV